MLRVSRRRQHIDQRLVITVECSRCGEIFWQGWDAAEDAALIVKWHRCDPTVLGDLGKA